MLINGFPNDILCGFEKCDITSDGKKFACGCREIGIVFFELGNPGEPIVKKKIFIEIGTE